MNIFKKLKSSSNKGCISCGSNEMLTIPIKEVNITTNFIGYFLRCGSCGRYFCDSIFIDEDMKTFHSIEQRR